MSLNQDRLKYLLEQYAEKIATDEEVLEMFALIKKANEADDEGIKMWLTEKLAATEPATNYDHKRWNKVLANILSPLAPPVPAAQGNDTNSGTMPGKVRKLHVWKRVAAAACIIFAFGAGWYFLSNKPENLKPTEVAQTNDVKPPASNRATITLANGQVVYLDSASKGTLAQQGNVSLQKLADGQIVYNGESSIVNSELVYNTLTNPRGSKVIDMTLSDGTKVWLNAGSSVTYPVAFIGKERKVSMNGEAYFEVKHNAAMPFIVGKGNMEVTVLGTHFNVNAYDDEKDIKVTLLEGSVKVVNGEWSIVNGKKQLNGQELFIKPGEQAEVDASVNSGGNPSTPEKIGTGALRVTKNADLNEVMAWKNGKFYFDGADIKTVMRQLARWYNVEVDYKANINYSFVAKISRDVPVSELLKLLELTEGVHFKVEGTRITVMK